MVFAITILWGPTPILRHLWASDQLAQTQTALWILSQVRLPRSAVCALSGACLGMAGVISQGFFRNPLASPMGLGATSGAGFACALLTYFSPLSQPTWNDWWCLPVVGCAGALLATLVMLALLRTNRSSLETSPEQLLLAGMTISAVLGAASSLLLGLALEEPHRAARMMHWLLGGFVGITWDHLYLALLPAFLGIFIALQLPPKLDPLILGEDIATTLGVDIRTLQWQVVTAIALLVGGSVCVAGNLPFVGLVVPHLSRHLVGARHGRLLMISALNGATLVLTADFLSRTLAPPRELEVGIFTAMLGGSFLLVQLRQRLASRPPGAGGPTT